MNQMGSKNHCPNLEIPAIPVHHISTKHKKKHQHGNHRKDCGPTVPIKDCDERIRLVLAGLHGSLNFDLLTHIGCDVTIKTDRKGKAKEITGKIADAGIDFVTIIQKNDETVTVLQDHIVKVIWTDKDCKPCKHH